MAHDVLGVGGAATGTVAGAAVVGSLFGVAGAGVTGYKMKKRVGDVEEFLFVNLPPGEGSRLHVTLVVPGWTTNLLPSSNQNSSNENDDVDTDDTEGEDSECDDEALQCNLMQSFDSLIHSREQYGLQYETKYLAEMGQAMDKICSMAVSMAATELLKMTIFNGMLHIGRLF